MAAFRYESSSFKLSSIKPKSFVNDSQKDLNNSSFWIDSVESIYVQGASNSLENFKSPSKPLSNNLSPKSDAGFNIDDLKKPYTSHYGDFIIFF